MGVRRDILTNLQTKLLTITTGNGYNMTIGQVFKKVKLLSELSTTDYPCACLDIRAEKTEYQDGCKTHIWELGIIVYVSSNNDISDEALLTEQMEKAYEDITNLIEYDYVSAANVESISVDGMIPFSDSDNNNGFIYVPITITYITN